MECDLAGKKMEEMQKSKKKRSGEMAIQEIGQKDNILIIEVMLTL